MEIHELVIEMKLLERRLTLYEEKYGILSEDFHAALTNGKLARYDEYDESRADFSRWKGIYETWLRRKQQYTKQMQERRSERNFAGTASILTMGENPVASLANYSGFIAQALDRPSVAHSTVVVWSSSPYTGVAEGDVSFANGYWLRLRQELDFEAKLITSFGD